MMSKAHRIDKSLLTTSLAQEIDNKLGKDDKIDWSQIKNPPQLSDGNWKPPVSTFDSLPLTDNGIGDIRLVLDTNFVYTWNGTLWDEIGANDPHISWDEIQDKPSSFPPIVHRHNWSELDSIPDSFTPSVHQHVESDIIDLDKYTQSEVDSLLLSKVDAIPGKELSSNDFTDNDKNKLDSLSDNASVDYAAMLNRLESHEGNTDIHLSTLDIVEISKVQNKADKTYVDTELAKKAESSTVSGHIGNTSVHASGAEKSLWNMGITTYGITQPTSGIWFKEVL